MLRFYHILVFVCLYWFCNTPSVGIASQSLTFIQTHFNVPIYLHSSHWTCSKLFRISSFPLFSFLFCIFFKCSFLFFIRISLLNNNICIIVFSCESELSATFGNASLWSHHTIHVVFIYKSMRILLVLLIFGLYVD